MTYFSHGDWNSCREWNSHFGAVLFNRNKTPWVEGIFLWKKSQGVLQGVGTSP